jgi:GNAT superfamily N-acetyltransferase
MIRTLDPATAADEVLSRIYDLRLLARREGAPEAPFESREDVVALLRHPPDTSRAWLWAVGEPPHAFAELYSTPGNPTGFARVVVAVDARRRGIGRALLAAVCVRARDAGCELLAGAVGTPVGEEFVRAAGGTLGRRYLHSVLRLPAGLPASPPPAGYRMLSWTGAVADDLLETYATARNAIHDAPVDEGVTLDEWTPATVRAAEESVAAQGRQLRITVALDPAGAVAAYTELRGSPEPGALARTEDTAVVRAHRGRGLATAVKVESLRLLMADRPDVALVTTMNAAENAGMLAVNRKVGFTVTGGVQGVILAL